jgi:hypothetical protein
MKSMGKEWFIGGPLPTSKAYSHFVLETSLDIIKLNKKQFKNPAFT